MIIDYKMITSTPEADDSAVDVASSPPPLTPTTMHSPEVRTLMLSVASSGNLSQS